MAIFGWDFYGLSKYGAPIHIDFGVEPFTAVAISHDQIRVSWSEPSGNWTNFRLLVNRSGYSINEDDGIVILDIDSGTTPGSVVDDAPISGWYYYTIFILNDDLTTWERAGTASALGIFGHRMAQRMWELTPQYFRTIKDDTAGYSAVNFALNPGLYQSQDQNADNLHLWSFYNVLGWGLDLVRTQADTILWDYDTRRINFDRLALLSNQFGAEIERAVPAQTSRNLVRNLGLLYRKRGTPSGIEEMLALSTGWNVDVSLGPNIMLSEDQANFLNPVVQDWDKGSRYLVGERVLYNGRYFTCIVIAYGQAQKPPLSGANTWWDDLGSAVEENVALVRGDTGNVGTWEAFDSATGNPLRTITSTHIGRGVKHPVDPDIISANALGVKNTTSGTTDLIVRSAPWYNAGTDFDRELTLSSVIPVPIAVRSYVMDEEYHQGDTVNFVGVVYEALRDTTRYPLSTDWQPLGYDRRVRLCFSFYTHNKFVGGDTTNLVTPYLIGFNDVGDKIYDQVLTPNQVTNVNLETFNRAVPFAQDRALDIGGKTWNSVRGAWDINWDWDDGGAVFPSSPDPAYGWVNSTISDCVIGVTFRDAGGRPMGILFRTTDPASSGGSPPADLLNGWVATQTEVHKVTLGVASAASATWAPFVSGDRMTVHLSGSSIIVKKNGVQVASFTDSYLSSATKHGIIAL